ncbi:uncharacterized protein [Nerophis lumbriciformis]|uniref:uncharacterized protein n=1 Tax=Nerophis lumbriciformis TaxID=546530 RepID=UPI003BA97FF8
MLGHFHRGLLATATLLFLTQTGTRCRAEDDMSPVALPAWERDPVCPINCDFEKNLCGWQQIIQDSFDWTRYSGATPTNGSGPNHDHTTGAGFYMYIEGDSVTHGDSARLLSSECYYNGPVCLNFWYHMHGSATAMALNMYVLRGNYAAKIWSMRNNQGQEWQPGNIDINVSSPFQIIVEGIRGSDALSDVAIDDISIHVGACSSSLGRENEPSSTAEVLPSASACSLNCSFDSNLCSWNQMRTDAFDWAWQSGSTPTLMTGPSADHTGDGHYIYIEASRVSHGDTARLISSECFATGPQCLQFWYHMYGSADTMGLHVYLLQGNKADAIWRKRNDQGNMWHLAQVDLTVTRSFQIIFEGRRGSNDESDVAIDDVALYPGQCSELSEVNTHQPEPDVNATVPAVTERPAVNVTDQTDVTARPPETNMTLPLLIKTTDLTIHEHVIEAAQNTPSNSVCQLNCNFEENLCQWSQILADVFDWTRHRGPTSTVMTGPSSDHTTGYGHYLYVEANSASYGDTARLISSECSATGPHCLQFWYHMYGSAHTMGLHVYLLQGNKADAILWMRNDQGNVWHLAQVDFTTAGPFQIIFEGRRGSNDQSDVAVDDVSLYRGRCAVRMKEMARSYFWWPSLDAAIEEKAKSCSACQKLRNLPQLAPLHPWDWPEEPWQRVHVDFAGPLENHMFLVVIDAHSKWPEVAVMKSTSSERTIEELRSIFSRNGLPQQLVSDNGPQLVSEEFKAFMEENGIQHIKSAPYHTATNGLAEKFVQALKKALKSSPSTQTLNRRLNAFLLAYRNAPHATTKKPVTIASGEDTSTNCCTLLGFMMTHASRHLLFRSCVLPWSSLKPQTRLLFKVHLDLLLAHWNLHEYLPQVSLHPDQNPHHLQCPKCLEVVFTLSEKDDPQIDCHSTVTIGPQSTVKATPSSTDHQVDEETEEPRPQPTAEEITTPITYPKTTATPVSPTTESNLQTSVKPETPPGTVTQSPTTSNAPQPPTATTNEPQYASTVNPQHPNETQAATTVRPQPPTTTPSCLQNSHYTACISACGPTCRFVTGPPHCNDTEDCEPGCVCDDGYVLRQGVCVPVQQCGCVDRDGNKYSFGQMWYTSHCSHKCQCQRQDGLGEIDCDEEDECDGNAICLQNEQGHYFCQKTGFDRCLINGDPEYRTFDNMRHDFEGEHSYVLVQTKKLPSNLPDIYIEGNYTPTEHEDSSSEEDDEDDGNDGDDDSNEHDERHRLQGLKVEIYNHTVQFKKGQKLLVDGRKTKTPVSPTLGLKIQKHSSHIYIKTDFGLTVKFDGRNDAEITLPCVYKRKVGGLCGNFDGRKMNDRTKPDGTMARTVEEFGESWRV